MSKQDLFFWIGTYSDERIIELLKTQENKHQKLIFKHENFVQIMMSDKEIQENVIDKGLSPYGITHFFANNLSKAKTMAKEMGLKNFSQVSQTLYEKGKDY